jgi:hypothetical protein
MQKRHSEGAPIRIEESLATVPNAHRTLCCAAASTCCWTNAYQKADAASHAHAVEDNLRSQCVEIGGASSGRAGRRIHVAKCSIATPIHLKTSSHVFRASPLPCSRRRRLTEPSSVTSRTFPAARPAPRYIRTDHASFFFRPVTSRTGTLKPRFQEATSIPFFFPLQTGYCS